MTLANTISTCITGIIRVIALNDLKGKDISCTPLYSACLLTGFNGKADTLATEYLWSQVEPGTAIICACLVTYRPLFKDLKVGVSRLFSTHSWSSGTPESDQGRDLGSVENGHTEELSVQKCQSQNGSRLRDLNDKALKGKLHIIEISVPPSY